MNFVMIFGPQAVGKMTVGEELAKQTGMKLFHNHMTIDLLLKLFEWNNMQDLNAMFRDEIFKRFAKQENEVGLIFTYVFAFDLQSEWDYVKKVSDFYKEHDVYYVELVADLDIRLERNKTENRIKKKWTKQNIEENEMRIKETLTRHRTTSYPGEVKLNNYLRIDNTKMEPEEVAKVILANFQL